MDKASLFLSGLEIAFLLAHVTTAQALPLVHFDGYATLLLHHMFTEP